MVPKSGSKSHHKKSSQKVVQTIHVFAHHLTLFFQQKGVFQGGRVQDLPRDGASEHPAGRDPFLVSQPDAPHARPLRPAGTAARAQLLEGLVPEPQGKQHLLSRRAFFAGAFKGGLPIGWEAFPGVII